MKIKKIITVFSLITPTIVFPFLQLLDSYKNIKKTEAIAAGNESIKYMTFNQISYINFGNIYIEPRWFAKQQLKFAYIQKDIVLWNDTYVTLKGNNLFKYFKNNYSTIYFYGVYFFGTSGIPLIKGDWATYILPTIEIKKEIGSGIIQTNLEIPRLANTPLVKKNQNITLTKSDFAFGRDNKFVMPPSNVNIYETWEGVQNNFPKNIKTWNTKEQINGFPLVYVGYNTVYGLPDDYASITIFDYESLIGDKIDADIYNIKEIFETKTIDSNNATIFINNNYEKLNTYVNGELKFRIYYKTSSPNDNNKLINYSKTFIYNGIKTNENININNATFIPYAIEVLEYNDDNTFIQGCYKTL